jgi:cell division protein ZapA
MKQMEVTILGQSYLLACPEGGEALLQAAVSTVDQEMSAIRDAGKVKARERMAVLAALNLAYQLAERPAAVGRALDLAGTARRPDRADDPAPGCLAGRRRPIVLNNPRITAQ